LESTKKGKGVYDILSSFVSSSPAKLTAGKFCASNFGVEGANKLGFRRQKYVNLFHIMAGVYMVRGLVGRAADRFLNDNRELA
jgi:hypothetical protein